MTGTETIFLVMADTARRATCFAALTGAPHRIVRGFGSAHEAIAALDSCDHGCMVIANERLEPGALSRLLHAVAQYPALVTLLLADTLEATEALALIRAAHCDLLPCGAAPNLVAERIDDLLPLARQRGDQSRAVSAARAMVGRLSPRETQVLSALAGGCTSKDIARALGVSPRTIEVHRASIMRRTGAATLADLLRLCFLADLMASTITSKAA